MKNHIFHIFLFFIWYTILVYQNSNTLVTPAQIWLVFGKNFKWDAPILKCVFFTFSWFTLTPKTYFVQFYLNVKLFIFSPGTEISTHCMWHWWWGCCENTEVVKIGILEIKSYGCYPAFDYVRIDATTLIEIGSAVLMIMMTRVIKNVRRVDIVSSSGTDLYFWCINSILEIDTFSAITFKV